MGVKNDRVHLFSPLSVKSVTLRNRIGVSPMCQYSSEDGFANDWHFAHLAQRAIGGAGLIFTEAAGVTPEGRISPEDLGVWSEKHFEPLERITHFVVQQGAVPGIQLAHAGRKASTFRPWSGAGEVKPDKGGWQVVGPSPEPFADNYPKPKELSVAEIGKLQEAFVTAAKRSVDAGFRVIEVHGAHGYLFHEFYSPLSNRRTDQYGGSFENRTRFLRDSVAAVRGVLPDRCPLFVRISCTDWTEGGWDIEQSVELGRQLKALGVDVIDCSTGGNVKDAKIPVGTGYQTPFAARIRRDADIATAAVGLITGAAQADHIVQSGQADLVLLARELLRSPYWPLEAARELGFDASWPSQYLRAAPKGAPDRTPAHEID
jgi:2,4-dienoyl-CoA reductase-like NADH-dependent reductase (Old Yellow Enzyme family)